MDKFFLKYQFGSIRFLKVFNRNIDMVINNSIHDLVFFNYLRFKQVSMS